MTSIPYCVISVSIPSPCHFHGLIYPDAGMRVLETFIKNSTLIPDSVLKRVGRGIGRENGND